MSDLRQDLDFAYKKLKHYYFLDSSALDLRYKIAEWEQKFEENINQLYLDLQMFAESGESHFTNHNLGFYSFPKGFKPPKKCDGIYSNITGKSEIKSCFYFVDAPIEVHIIATLWSMKVGQLLEKDHPNIDVCYGNRLKLKDDHISPTNQALFEPFFVKYNQWRDDAISTALEALKNGKNIVLLSLDISSFYDSVRIEPKEFCDAKFGDQSFIDLSRLLMHFHAKYELARGKNEDHNELDKEKYRLPIGLLSSGIIANWYLKQFDQDILNARPIHYGRYVDDLLIVFEVPNLKEFQKEECNPKNYIKTLLPGVFEDDEENKALKIKSRDNLKINPEKCSIFILDHTQPRSLLTLLQQDIKNNSSGFKFLPVEDDVNSEFENSIGSLQYREANSAKVRDIHGLIPARFKITQYLARHIFFSHNLGHIPSENVGKQMVSYFKGSRAIENYSQWERVFTYLFVNNSVPKFTKDFRQLVKNIISAIKEMSVCSLGEKPKTCEDELGNIKDSLRKHLSHCLLLCQALNPQRWVVLSEKFQNTGFNFDYTVLRLGGMVRHKYMPYPILAATQYASYKNCTNSLIDRDALRSMNQDLLNYNETLKKNFPTYIHFHDLALKIFWDNLRSDKNTPSNLFANQNFDDISKEFCEWNGIEYKSFIKTELNPSQENKIFKVFLDSKNTPEDDKNKLCIALANIQIEEKDLEASLSFFKQPNKQNRKPFDHIFNQITKYNDENTTKKIDLVVFPELSMPFDFLYGLCKQVKKSDVGVVTGLTYIVLENNYVLNVEAVILPLEINGFPEAVPILRVKNYYAPSEKEMIESHSSKDGQFYKVAEPMAEADTYYHLIHWRNMHFTVFNCFELTNIEHRAHFRGKVDCLIATEFNSDLAYFSNIVESTARDLHCFVIQSNNAKYGDSRICAPYKKDQKDIIQIKGGKNPTILVEQISITELREFQSTGYAKQKEHPKLKPTPAGFDRELSNSRFGKGN